MTELATMSIDDCNNAIDVLDAFEAAQVRAHARAETEAKAKAAKR